MLLGKCAPLFLFVARTKIPLRTADKDSRGRFLMCQCIQTLVIAGFINSYFLKCPSWQRVKRLSTSAVVDSSQSVEGLSSNYKLSRKSRKRTPLQNLEAVFKFELDCCCKDGKFAEGLQLYDEARKNGINLTQYHYNVLLYLCSTAGSGSLEEGSCENPESLKRLAMKRGFDIFRQMASAKIAPNEATFTNAARLAATIEDPEMAFDLVKEMKNNGIPPRLKSYGPALYGFCKMENADKAYDVDTHMVDSEVLAEESELAALLGVSVLAKRAEKVYEFLHRLRASVRQPSPSSAQIVKDWFNSDSAAIVGSDCWDVVKINKSIARRGGGWHGQGWLGSGKWNVAQPKMDAEGLCQSCGEKLACIDIDPKETENFASSLIELAFKRETKATFVRFQEWHGPFDAVIDGANVGMIRGHFFSFFQLNCAVNELREMSPSKRYPLVILHQSRMRTGPALEPRNKKLLESWKKAGALFEAPVGSNDDWYWLYAAVSSNCLIVTNDEMRDLLFQLLGTSFFPRWKEKHQVRLSASPRGLVLHMPPPYSVVIQESENGSWHVPIVTGDDLEAPRQWLGCGHGLPAIFACLQGATTVHFQYFNAEVLRCLTIPNFNANMALSLHVGGEVADKDIRFFAGDWSNVGQLLPFVQDSEKDHSLEISMGYDVILMAETVYSISSLPSLYELIKKCLCRPTGVVYMAAKKHYFGVGGGSRRFLSVMDKDGVMTAHLISEVTDGSSNVREVWKLSFKQVGTSSVR